MVTITLRDIQNVAKMSRLRLEIEEEESMQQDLEAVLSYASGLAALAQLHKGAGESNEERAEPMATRPDTPLPQDPDPLLAEAPQREDRYFVVPVIIG